jgi:hypothetical protein
MKNVSRFCTTKIGDKTIYVALASISSSSHLTTRNPTPYLGQQRLPGRKKLAGNNIAAPRLPVHYVPCEP